MKIYESNISKVDTNQSLLNLVKPRDINNCKYITKTFYKDKKIVSQIMETFKTY